jgi:CheY-like chemotaxis protein
MDHMMPGLDGVETTLAIRKIGTEYATSIPIIALTANVFADKDNIFNDNGFQGFLSKPIDLQKLDAVLRTWLPV